MKEKKKMLKRVFAFALAVAMVCTTVLCADTTAFAASKTKITVKESELILSKGEKVKIHASVKTKKGGSKTLTYKSSDKSVATVNKNGTVTAKNAGASVITVKATDGSKVSVDIPVSVSGYTAEDLIWEDNFDGDTLNSKYWNFEQHEPGWVNNELQSYPSEEENKETQNVTVKDGMLTIQAKKSVGEDGKVSYTSGRINTQNKVDTLYGKFEVRAKVPDGKGFLPAFWMMPTNENLYGQWPKCGEIDIMEVLGDATDTAYGTLHFGEPHTQKQGSYTLDSGDFSKEFHVFACEWDPDEIRFYVDGHLFYSINDWFSKKSGFGEVTYPAPYDQPFYMILNLAVGGDWPGYPDDDAVFADNAQLVVDYVKVYQKKSYNTNVSKPENTVVLRDPDEKGNYVINGGFTKAESLNDGELWELLLAGDGAATAKISKKALHINTTNAGTLDYSVQIVQPNIPMEQGYQYKLSFDAYADEARTMITAITAPDNGYIRYLNDTKVALTTKKKTYSYTFDMTEASDANGRIEFNLGNQGSVAGVHITNVKIKKVKKITIAAPEKSVLPDGNYVYNGEFQEGADRLDYWTVKSQVKGASVKVTNKNNVRELKAVVPSGVTKTTDLIVKQSEIAIKGGKQYQLSFDARRQGGEDKKLSVKLAGETFTAELTNQMTNYKFDFKTAADTKAAVLEFLLGSEGTTYIDNVRIVESGLIINGDFSSGLTGFEVYAYTPTNVTYGIDNLAEGNDNAFCMNISDTGDQDWYVQLKQTNIKLEKDQYYKISFRAKSDLDRSIMFALQRDGNKHNDDWTPYFENRDLALTKDWTEFSYVFRMDYDSDPETSMSFSMGAVGGKQITDKHTVTIDDIVLEAASEEEKKTAVNTTSGGGGGSWSDSGSTSAAPAEILGMPSKTWNAVVKEGASANITMKDSTKGADVTIENAGNAAGDVKLELSQFSVSEKDIFYFSSEVMSNQNKQITVKAMQGDTSLAQETYSLTANQEKQVSLSVNGNLLTSAAALRSSRLFAAGGNDVKIVFEMGKHDEEPDGSAAAITITNCVVTDCRLVKKEAPFASGWKLEPCEGGGGSVSYNGASATVSVTAVGTEDYSVKFLKNGLTLENGKKYNISFDITSTKARTVSWGLIDPNDSWNWYTGSDETLEEGVSKTISQTYTCDGKPGSKTIQCYFSLGQMYQKDENGTIDKTNKIDTPASDITISNLSITLEPEAGSGSAGTDEPEQTTGKEMLQNRDFSAMTDGKADSWTFEVAAGLEIDAAVSYTDNQAAITINNLGNSQDKYAEWQINLKQSVTFVEGHKYQLSYTASSTVEREIKVDLINQDAPIERNRYDYQMKRLTNQPQSFKETVTCQTGTSGDVEGFFRICVGKIKESEDESTTQPSVITISDVSVIDLGAAANEDGSGSTGEEGSDPAPAENLLDTNGWIAYANSPASMTNNLSDGAIPSDGVELIVSAVGDNEYDAALQKEKISLKAGEKYKVTYWASSTADRDIKVACALNEEPWTVYGGGKAVSLTSQLTEYTFYIDAADTDRVAVLKFQVGKQGENTATSTIVIKDIKLEKVTS